MTENPHRLPAAHGLRAVRRCPDCARDFANDADLAAHLNGERVQAVYAGILYGWPRKNTEGNAKAISWLIDQRNAELELAGIAV